MISLELSRATAGRTSTIEIRTDHPDQPELKVDVLVLPGERANKGM